MRQVLYLVAAVILAISLIAAAFTYNSASREETELKARLESRAQLLSESLAESITPSFLSGATSTVQRSLDRFADRERTAGLAIVDASGSVVARSASVPGSAINSPIIATAMNSASAQGTYVTDDGSQYYIYAVPLMTDGSVAGALVMRQDAQYIQETVASIWIDSMTRHLIQVFFVAGAIFVLVNFVFRRAIEDLVESVRSVRSGETRSAVAPGNSLLSPLTHEISKMSASLRQARVAASEEARMRLEKLDSPWTAERLKEFVKAHLRDRPIFVVSNAQPYVNSKVRGEIEWKVPAGGVITAIEPIMEACEGVWIAYGSGEADREVADKDGKLRVPPEEPKYTLKRVWLTPKERKGFYNGFCNEALWPLCHTAHIRPEFRKEDWTEYRKVNGLFAKTLLEEVRHIERPVVLVQDYQLALVPALIKKARPDAQVAIFWHIPWPSAAQFSICPWRKEILRGMLGADLVGFHTQQYCNNFIDTVGAEIESLIDFEHFTITREGHRSYIKPFPISIAFPGAAEPSISPDRDLLADYGVHTEHVILGVDRLDYTKGIPERFRAVEFLLANHPEYRGKVTLLQIGSPTRESAGKYGEYRTLVKAEADRINALFGTNDWKPIVLHEKSYSHTQLRQLYQLANVCLVTPVHDGMNLVSKEFVAARKDELGVLILSSFTGASRDMKGALIVNPYSAEETADAIHKALIMRPTEQHRRMRQLRRSVSDYNVYRWSAEIIKTLTGIE
jgi:trehalose-6-phosphate synthase